MDKITLAVDYWGKGEIDALFLRHEGYIGARHHDAVREMLALL
jgi:pantothenate kinase